MYALWLTSFACRFAPPHAQLPKSFPTDYPATFCSVSNPTAASAECIASLKLQFFSPDNAVTICQGASSKAPAEMCANDKSISSSLNSDQIASLCPSSTTSDAPPKCFKKVRLGDESYLLPLKSFIHQTQTITLAPFKLSQTPASFTADDSVRLCSGSPSTYPADCASAVDNKLKRKLGDGGSVALCRGAEGT